MKAALKGIFKQEVNPGQEKQHQITAPWPGGNRTAIRSLTLAAC